MSMSRIMASSISARSISRFTSISTSISARSISRFTSISTSCSTTTLSQQQDQRRPGALCSELYFIQTGGVGDQPAAAAAAAAAATSATVTSSDSPDSDTAAHMHMAMTGFEKPPCGDDE